MTGGKLHKNNINIWLYLGFPGGSESKESACSAGDTGSIPGSGRSPRDGNGNLLQYSCLGNPLEEEPGWLHSMWSQKELDMT